VDHLTRIADLEDENMGLRAEVERLRFAEYGHLESLREAAEEQGLGAVIVEIERLLRDTDRV
jgi:hypothetical protein